METNRRDTEKLSQKNKQHGGTENRGFASMPKEKVQEIASKGGHARAEQEGHEGMAELGRKGGQARAEQLGHEGYVELGRKGGHARAEQAGHEGMSEMGRKGGQASHSGGGRSYRPSSGDYEEE